MSIINGLYSIEEQSEHALVIQLSTQEHPIFQAHFPSFPILPGFALIDIVAECLNDVIIRLKSAKFMAHIQPEDRLFLTVKNANKERTIQVFNNKVKVSEIRYARE